MCRWHGKAVTDEGLLITLTGALENGKDFCASQSLRDSSPRTEATKRRWKDGSWIKNKTERAFTLSVLWSECRDSNSRPLEPHSSAIPNFATPGYFVCRSLGDFDIIPQARTKCKHYFRFFQKIFSFSEMRPKYRLISEKGKIFRTFYSPRSLLTTLPMFHRWATVFSASFFCSSLSYSR